MMRPLLAVLGRRAGLTFGVVTLLVSALLATVDITSRRALKLYVEDQLSRIPWDLALYQRSVSSELDRITARLGTVDGIEQVESLAFLRARFPNPDQVSVEIGGKPLTTPWLSVLAASNPSLLPNGVGRMLADGKGAVLALVGPERAMGPAFLALQGAPDFRLHVQAGGQARRLLFDTPLRGVIRVDRDELNRWFMDQTGSVTYVPYVGVILLMPMDPHVLARFDSVANGLVPEEVVDEEEFEEGHIQLAEYQPEVMLLGRLRREALISGWDIPASRRRVAVLNQRVRALTEWLANAPPGETEPPAPSAGPIGTGDPEADIPTREEENASGFVVDSTTYVLLSRMEAVARLVGVVTLLVALPLLWMGWVLAANLCGLLMLNERRTLGLLRLRGVAGRLLGRAFLYAILAGGTVGGSLGLVLGSVGPLLVYEGGHLPIEVLLQPQQLAFAVGFLVVSVLLALAVSRRLIRFATTVSPLEASRRVSSAEVASTGQTFGPLQGLALLAGLYTLVISWILGQPLSSVFGGEWATNVDRLLGFIGLPLLIYGVATLLASKRSVTQAVLDLLVRPIGGTLGHFAIRHLATKPHRTAAFLLIVALMASVTLYPTITSRSFLDKAERGARVQLGGDLQLLFNSPDVAGTDGLSGSLERQLAALRGPTEQLVAEVRKQPGIVDATYMYETVLPQFYLPGYGLKGVPMYVIGDMPTYMARAYAEPVVGLSAPFQSVMEPLAQGQIASSPPIADFWQLEPGLPVLLGMDRQRGSVSATASGVLAYLPGIPPRSVTDRQGYVQARIDYLNHLFTSNAYVVSAASSRDLQPIELLIPRVIILAWTADGASMTEATQTLSSGLRVKPLEIHDLVSEVGKVGSDMFMALALANLRIYLFGGLLLAVIAILSIAVANYTEDRRTLALLRIRGVSPSEMRRFMLGTLLSPAALGLIVGGATALVGGFGLANYVWQLREIQTVVQLLPTHLRTSWGTGIVAGVLVLLLAAVASGFSSWVYRRTAHQRVREA